MKHSIIALFLLCPAYAFSWQPTVVDAPLRNESNNNWAHSLMGFNHRVINGMGYGFIPLGNYSPVEFGPILQTLSGNTLEGFRMQAGIRTTPYFSKRLSFYTYLAYGFGDHKLKYGADATYVISGPKVNSPENPYQSISASYAYDTYFIGQRFPDYLSHHSIMQSLSRHPNYWINYRQDISLKYTYSPNGWLKWEAGMRSSRFSSANRIHFVNSQNDTTRHVSTTVLEVTLSGALSNIDESNPLKFAVSQIYGPSGILGSDYTVSQTIVTADKYTSLGEAGGLDISLRGSATWSSVPYVSLDLPASNLTRRYIQTTFMLMRPMEFTSDRHLSLFMTYSPEGRLLGLISALRPLNLRTLFSANAVIGHLTDRNNPLKRSDIPLFPDKTSFFRGARPYLEVGVGIGNIFNLIRIDYLWRLTYRNNPEADRSGLRIGLTLH